MKTTELKEMNYEIIEIPMTMILLRLIMIKKFLDIGFKFHSRVFVEGFDKLVINSNTFWRRCIHLQSWKANINTAYYPLILMFSSVI